MTLQTVPPVSRETIEGWQAQLDELFPKSEFASHLKIVWVAGDDWEIEDEGEMVWQGVERFYLFEMLPENAVDPYLLSEVKEMPRPVVRYDSVMKSVSRSDAFCTRMQWDLFKETGYYARPLWVIQGSNGGHARFFSQVEKKFLELASLPTDPPLPGTLPYAPFDQRVMRQMVRLDRMRKKDARLADMRETRIADYKKDQEELERTFRGEILAFLRDQIDETTGKEALRGLQELDMPRSETNYEKLLEEGEERFLETGTFS